MEKVRAKELGDSDGEGVEFFIRSLEMMSNVYGDQAVCAATPKCMKGAAKDSLDYREIRYMQWVDQWVMALRGFKHSAKATAD